MRSAMDLLALPDISLQRLATLWPDLATIPASVSPQIETDARYAAYLDRQDSDIRAYRRDESLHLPTDLDFHSVGGLSHEMIQRLSAGRPRTLGQAARLPGVTPAAVVALMRFVRRTGDKAA